MFVGFIYLPNLYNFENYHENHDENMRMEADHHKIIFKIFTRFGFVVFTIVLLMNGH